MVPAAKPRSDPDAVAACKKRVARLAAQTMFHHHFFAAAHMKLAASRYIVDNTHWCKTAAVNGKSIWINAPWFMTLTEPEALYVLLHEYLHCMLCHMLRRGARDPYTFNIAGDAIINALLDEYQQQRGTEIARIARPQQSVDLPKYKSWDIVSAYNDLWQEVSEPPPPPDEEGDEEGPVGPGDKPPKDDGEDKPKGKPKRKVDDVKGEPLDDVQVPGANSEDDGDDDDSATGGDDTPRDGAGDDPSEGEWPTGGEDATKLERDWQDVLISAATTTRAQGKLPGCFAQLVEDYLNPPANWYARLMDFFRERAPTDTSWARQNRRFIGQGVYLPGLDGVRCNDIIIGCDASGSVSDKEFSLIVGALNDAFEELRPETVTVAQWDTHISDVIDYTEDDLPISDVRRKGYGGTDPANFFAWVKANKPDAEIVVCITDGEFGLPAQPDGLDILWLVTRPAAHITYGTVIYCPVA